MSDVSVQPPPSRRRAFRYDPSRVRGEEVYGAARRHSGLVRWLKIVLPGLAVAGVVAFVLAIKVVTSDIGELFSLAGVAIDTKSLVMEKPHLSGFKGTEHSYEVHAERAIQDLANPKIVRLEEIAAEFGLSSDVRVSLGAAAGVFDGNTEVLALHDGITVSSTDGYSAKLETVTVDFGEGSLQSERPVEISATEGLLRSQKVSVSERGKKVIFSGGVSVTYMPPETPEGATAAAPGPESE
jgi:lipopolysaccharide export system protein LptC